MYIFAMQIINCKLFHCLNYTNMINIHLTKSDEKIFPVVKVHHYISCTDQEIAFVINGIDDEGDKLSFDIFQIFYSAIVETVDGETRQCVCFHDEYNTPTWIDINEYEERFLIFNYKSYCEKMNHIRRTPYNYLTYIAFKMLDSSIEPEGVITDYPSQDQYSFSDETMINESNGGA